MVYWEGIILGVFISWTLFIIIYVNCIFKKSLSYMNNPEVQNDPRYPAFTRRDFPKWNFFEMTLVGIFIFPIRMILIGFILILGCLFARLAAILMCVGNFFKNF